MDKEIKKNKESTKKEQEIKKIKIRIGKGSCAECS